MSEPREILTWDRFGSATRELATVVAADGYYRDRAGGRARWPDREGLVLDA